MILPSAFVVNTGCNDLLLNVRFFLKKSDYRLLSGLGLWECSQDYFGKFVISQRLTSNQRAGAAF